MYGCPSRGARNPFCAPTCSSPNGVSLSLVPIYLRFILHPISLRLRSRFGNLLLRRVLVPRFELLDGVMRRCGRRLKKAGLLEIEILARQGLEGLSHLLFIYRFRKDIYGACNDRSMRNETRRLAVGVAHGHAEASRPPA